jgi:hypothetical protein
MRRMEAAFDNKRQGGLPSVRSKDGLLTRMVYEILSGSPRERVHN